MAGIKETLEAIALLDKTADAITAAKADGSIDWRDVVKLAPVVVAMKTAVEGGHLIPGELKELDATETQALFTSLVESATKLAMAVIS